MILPSFKSLHFCITLPASSRGSNSSPWHMAQNNRDALLKVAPSAAAVCQYWSPSPAVGESLCFQPRVLASVWVQQCPAHAKLKYSRPQDFPKQSMKKEKKALLFFKQCIWEYLLNFQVWIFRSHFVLNSYSASLLSHCPIHSPSIPNIRAKVDCFPLWNLRISSFLDMRQWEIHWEVRWGKRLGNPRKKVINQSFPSKALNSTP